MTSKRLPICLYYYVGWTYNMPTIACLDEEISKMKLPSRLVKVLFFLMIAASMCLLPMTFVKIVDCSSITVNHRVHIEEEYIWVMGEVINSLDTPIRNVSVGIKCYDDNNTLIEEANTTAWLSVILSERRAPFVKGFERKELKEFASCTVNVKQYEICEPKPKGLSISTAVLTYIGPEGVEIEGLVKNEGTENVTKVIVMGMFYDDKGFLATSSDFPERMSPGDEKPFNIFSKFVTQPSPFRKYILTAESKNYTIVQEKSKEFPPPEDTENTGVDYRVIIIILVVMTTIIASLVAIAKSRSKKRKRKARRVK